MRLKAFAAAAALAAALSGATAASATVGHAVFTGTVANNASRNNVFGAVAGQDFTAIWDFDTALGVHALSPGNSESNYGGVVTGPNVSPILFASLTINGITRAFDASDYGNNQTYTQIVGIGGGHTVFEDDILFVANGADGAQLLNRFGTLPHLMGGDFLHSFSVTPSGPQGLGMLGTFHTGPGADTILNADHLTVTMQLGDAGGGAVPEPAAWGLMIMGFGAVGSVLRNRRRLALAA